MKTLLTLFLFFTLNSNAIQNETILLGLGESKRISLKGANSVWIENKQIVTATASDGSVTLKGVRSGESLVRVGNQNKKVQVIHPSQMDSYSSLQSVVKNIAGLSVDALRGNIAVKGKLYSLSDWKKLARFDLHYQMRADISASLQGQAEDYFKALMRKERLPVLNLIFSDAIEMRVNPKSHHIDKYKNLLSPYGIQIATDPDVLETAPTIKVQITVAEIKNKFKNAYGIDWPKAYSAQIFSGLTKGETNGNALVHAIETQGYGKILASPNIVCRSGKEAEFLAGGEIPIMVRNYKTHDVIWKKYGVFLKVKPLADSSGRMSISIETEVSTLDGAYKAGELPGILTNRVSSHFDLNKPQTIALSGLIKSESSDGYEGLPLLSRIPILGPLFSSRDFNEQKSELVIFVRPIILEEDEATPNTQTHLGTTQWQ